MIFDELIRCRAWIEAALDRADGEHTFDDIAGGILTGRYVLWPLPSGCMVTEIVTYPRKRVLNVFLGGGNLDEIVAMHDIFEQFGKANGCSRMTVSGRKGWGRALLKHGWEPMHTSMKKEFSA